MFLRNKINFLIAVIFLSSCSSMNVTEERVYSDDVKTVQASSSDSIQYDNKAVFANATIYFGKEKGKGGEKKQRTRKYEQRERKG